MIRATYSYFAMPGQDWAIAFRDHWSTLPRWLVSSEFRRHTYRAHT